MAPVGPAAAMPFCDGAVQRRRLLPVALFRPMFPLMGDSSVFAAVPVLYLSVILRFLSFALHL